MAYVNPVPQNQQQETLQQENPSKVQDMMLLANAIQPPTSQPQQQQQQGGGGGMNSMMNQFMGGGGAGGGAAGGMVASANPSAGTISSGSVMPNVYTEAIQSGVSGAGGGSAAGAGEAAGGGSAAAGGGMGAGFWAALAAAIIGNENQALDQGDRRSGSDYWKDLATGEVLQQDITDRWGPKVFGDNEYGFGGDALFGAQLSQGDLGDAWNTLKDQSTLAKLLGRGSDKDWRDYT